MDTETKTLLLELARESIFSELEDDKLNLKPYEHLNDKHGCFVTLHKGSKLRGCIGFTEPIYPLYQLVYEAAQQAAFHDPRFPPVRKEEMAKITIEISILTKPQLLQVEEPEDYLKKIRIGKDGLILKGPNGSGLLLPQVATEHHMDTHQFLNAVSQKAGLSFEAWKDLDNKLFTFQAEIIKES